MSYSVKSNIKKVFVLVLIVAVASIIGSIYLICNILAKSDDLFEINNERVLTNGIISFIEKDYNSILKGSEKAITDLSKMSDSIKAELRIITTSGRVVFDSLNKNVLNENIVLNIKDNLAYDKSFKAIKPGYIRFTIPIVVDDIQVANAVFTIEKRNQGNGDLLYQVIKGLLPVLTGIFIMLVALIYIGIKIRKDIIIPVNELNKAAESIAAGNMDRKIRYSDDSEIGKFCSSFEFMRDELKNSIEKQRELEKSRKELVACISHDLRTPIASIKAYAEALRDGIAKNPEITSKYVSVIGKKSDDLVKLINDLFEHSQAELGEFKISFQECYSGSILYKIINPIIMEFQNSGLNFHVDEIFPDILIKIDVLRIEQVITNLIQNAKKYTPNGGHIYFSARIQGRFLEITVKDTGIGISQRDLPYIFEKFYRGEKSRSRDHGGAGLGLSICKYIVEAHGGTISVESRENEGSKFSFTIPKL